MFVIIETPDYFINYDTKASSLGDVRFGCVEIVETLQNGTKVHSMESASFPRSSLARAIGYDVHDGFYRL